MMFQAESGVNPNDRALSTAPEQLSVEDNSVRARVAIPARVRFGPLEGDRIPVDQATPDSWLVSLMTGLLCKLEQCCQI